MMLGQMVVLALLWIKENGVQTPFRPGVLEDLL